MAEYADVVREKLSGWCEELSNDDVRTFYRVRHEFAKQEVRERLVQYAEDGWQVFLDADDFWRLSCAYEEQEQAFGDEYISDWFHDELVAREIVVEHPREP